MLISVAICTRNPDALRFERVLDGLRHQDLPSDDWELLVVDNSSSKPLVAPDLPPLGRVRLLSEPRPGLFHARLTAIRANHAPLLVFIDDDTIPSPGFLRVLVNAFERNEQLVAAGPRIVADYYAGKPPDWVKEFDWALAIRDLGPRPLFWALSDGMPIPNFTPIGAGMALRVSALHSYLDHARQHESEILARSWKGQGRGGNEDKDLIWHLVRCGGVVGYVPDAELRHLIPPERLTFAYFKELLPGLGWLRNRTLHAHGLAPAPPITTVGCWLRIVRSWIRLRAWRTPAERLRWEYATSTFRARAVNRTDQFRYGQPKSAPSGSADRLPAPASPDPARPSAIEPLHDRGVISVVVPTHNPRPGLLQGLYEALARQTLTPSLWELIVIDNASTPALAHDFGPLPEKKVACRLIREPSPGLTYARLTGFLHATGSLIVLLDDDNLPAPDFLRCAQEFSVSYPSVGVFGGRVTARYAAPPPLWFKDTALTLGCRDFGDKALFSQASSRLQSYPKYAPIGAGMVLRSQVAEQYVRHVRKYAGVITDRQGRKLTSGGDNEIVLVSLTSGWDAAYTPDLKIDHLIPPDRLEPRYLARLNRESSRSWVLLLERFAINPWPPLHPATLPLRRLRSWFRQRTWRGPRERIAWAGACGLLEGRAALPRKHLPEPPC